MASLGGTARVSVELHSQANADVSSVPPPPSSGFALGGCQFCHNASQRFSLLLAEDCHGSGGGDQANYDHGLTADTSGGDFRHGTAYVYNFRSSRVPPAVWGLEDGDRPGVYRIKLIESRVYSLRRSISPAAWSSMPGWYLASRGEDQDRRNGQSNFVFVTEYETDACQWEFECGSRPGWFWVRLADECGNQPAHWYLASYTADYLFDWRDGSSDYAFVQSGHRWSCQWKFHLHDWRDDQFGEDRNC